MRGSIDGAAPGAVPSLAMRSTPRLFWVAAALALLAAPVAADRRPAPRVYGPMPMHGKPSAPVTLTATAERTAGGWQVVVDAAPTRAVDEVVVEIDGRATRFGATGARQARHLVVPMALAGAAGKDVVVSVTVAGRNASAIVRIGAPAPAAKPVVTTPRIINGHVVAEVRP